MAAGDTTSGFNPSTFSLGCGFTKTDDNVSTTPDQTCTAGTLTIDGKHNIYFRRRLRKTKQYEDVGGNAGVGGYRLYTSANKADFLTNASTANIDAIEFVMCTNTLEKIAESALTGVVDNESVPIVADGANGTQGPEGPEGRNVGENLIDNSEPKCVMTVGNYSSSGLNQRTMEIDKTYVPDRLPADGTQLAGRAKITLSGCAVGSAARIVVYATWGESQEIVYTYDVAQEEPNVIYDIKDCVFTIRRGNTPGNGKLFLRLQNFAAQGTVTIERMKLEVGNKSTVWSLSENDKKGNNVPYYHETYYGWSAHATTANVETDPGDVEPWSMQVPSKPADKPYLWMKDLLMKWDSATQTYIQQGRWTYTRITGENGTGVRINGSFTRSDWQDYASIELYLSAEYPNPTTGDCYIYQEDGHLWVWNGTSWQDVGRIKGTDGTSQYIHWAWCNSLGPTKEGDEGYPDWTGLGTGFTTSKNAEDKYKYIGVLANNTESPDPGEEYAGHYEWNEVEGPQGPAGKNSIRIDLSNQTDAIAADSNGKARFARTITTTAKIYDGATPVKSGVTVTAATITVVRNGVSTPLTSNPTYGSGGATFSWTIQEGDVLSSVSYPVSISLSYGSPSVTYTAEFTLTRIDAQAVFQLLPSRDSIDFVRQANNTLSPSHIQVWCGYKKYTGSGTETYASNYNGEGVTNFESSGYSIYVRHLKADGTPNIWDATGNTSPYGWIVMAYTGDYVRDIYSNTAFSAVQFCIAPAKDRTQWTDADIIDLETIPIVKDGTNGADGKNSVRLALDNEHEDFLYSDTGLVAPSGGATSLIRLYDGDQEITSFEPTVYSVVGTANTTDASVAERAYIEGRTLYVKGLSADTAEVIVSTTYNGQPYYAKFTGNKVTQDKYDLIVKPNAIAFNPDSYTPQTVTFSARRTNGIGEQSAVTINPSTTITKGQFYVFYGFVDSSGNISADLVPLGASSRSVSAVECRLYSGVYFELRKYTSTNAYRLCDYETVEIAKVMNGADLGENLIDGTGEVKVIDSFDGSGADGISRWYNNMFTLNDVNLQAETPYSCQMRVKLEGCDDLNGRNFRIHLSTRNNQYPFICEFYPTKDGTYEVKKENFTFSPSQVNAGFYSGVTFGWARNNNDEITLGTITIDKVKLERGEKCSAWSLSENDKRGKDGDVWTIGEDGFWYCNGKKTGVKAEGKDGTGVEIKGGVDSYNTTPGKPTSLQGLDTSTIAYGDCYIVNDDSDAVHGGHLYFYQGGTWPDNWRDLGKIKGEPGSSSYMHIAYATGDVQYVTEQTVDSIGFTVNKGSASYPWMGICADNNIDDPGKNWSSLTNAQKVAAVNAYEWNYVKGSDADQVSPNILVDTEFSDAVCASTSHGTDHWYHLHGTKSGQCMGRQALYSAYGASTTGENCERIAEQLIYDSSVSKLDPNTWYTLSVYAKGNATLMLGLLQSGGYIESTCYFDGQQITAGNAGSDTFGTIALTGYWTRHTLTFRTKSSMTTTYELYASMRKQSPSSSAYISMPKLEVGESATAYMANEEDLRGADGAKGSDAYVVMPQNLIINQNLDGTMPAIEDILFKVKSGGSEWNGTASGTPTVTDYLPTLPSGVTATEAHSTASVSSGKLKITIGHYSYSYQGETITRYYDHVAFAVTVTANGVTLSHILHVYVNLLGTFVKTVESDVEHSIATKKYYVYDKDGNVVGSQTIGDYIRSSSENTARMSDTVTNLSTANVENLFGFTKGVKFVDSDWPVLPYIQGYGVEIYQAYSGTTRGRIQNLGFNGVEGSYVLSCEIKASQVVSGEVFTIDLCDKTPASVISGLNSDGKYEPSVNEWTRVIAVFNLTRETISDFDSYVGEKGFNGFMDAESNKNSGTHLYIRRLQIERGTMPSVFGICKDDAEYASQHDHECVENSAGTALDNTDKWNASPGTGGRFAATGSEWNGMKIYENNEYLNDNNGAIDGNYRLMELSCGSLRVERYMPYTISFWAKARAYSDRNYIWVAFRNTNNGTTSITPINNANQIGIAYSSSNNRPGTSSYSFMSGRSVQFNGYNYLWVRGCNNENKPTSMSDTVTSWSANLKWIGFAIGASGSEPSFGRYKWVALKAGEGFYPAQTAGEAIMANYLVCNNAGGNAYEEYSALEYCQSARTSADGYTNVRLNGSWQKYYVHFYSQVNYTNAYAVGIRISTAYPLAGCCIYSVCGLKFEKGYITSDDRMNYETVVHQTSRSIDMSVLVNAVKKAGIELTTNQEGDVTTGVIKAIADKFEIYNSAGTVRTFRVDENGNLEGAGNAMFTGKITATGGSITGNIDVTGNGKLTVGTRYRIEISPDGNTWGAKIVGKEVLNTGTTQYLSLGFAYANNKYTPELLLGQPNTDSRIRITDEKIEQYLNISDNERYTIEQGHFGSGTSKAGIIIKNAANYNVKFGIGNEGKVFIQADGWPVVNSVSDLSSIPVGSVCAMAAQAHGGYSIRSLAIRVS